MASRDSAKVSRAYSALAKALLEFERLWHGAWLKSVDRACRLLQAPLLVKHPQTGGRGSAPAPVGVPLLPLWWPRPRGGVLLSEGLRAAQQAGGRQPAPSCAASQPKDI
jgi:hypothetical protein